MTIPTNTEGLLAIPATVTLKNKAYYLKGILIAEIVTLSPLLLLGFFWVLLQIFTTGFGFYSVWDEQSFKPSILLYFFVTVFGAVYCAVNSALSINEAFQHAELLPWLAASVWSVAVIVLLIAAVWSWKLFKEMVNTLSLSLGTVHAAPTGFTSQFQSNRTNPDIPLYTGPGYKLTS